MRPQGSPFESTPTIRPASSNRPEPELPPETWKFDGTLIPMVFRPVTVAKDAWGREIFFTAPLG